MKCMRKNELAKLYGVSRITLWRWFKRNPALKHLATPQQIIQPKDLSLIRDILGEWGDE